MARRSGQITRRGSSWRIRWFEGIDPELQAAMARAYNRWGADMSEASGGRLLVSAPVPLNRTAT